MRKFLFLVYGFLFLLTISTTFAAPVTLTFNITNVSPILQSCVYNPLPYEIFTLNPTVTGNYTFTIVNPNYDYSMNLYIGGTFTTTNLCSNRINGGLVSMTHTLTAGQNYELVGVVAGVTTTGMFDVTVTAPTPVQVAANVASGDADGDGVDNTRDNCINEFNPGQEDGWGNSMGDPCDTEQYNRAGVGVQGFVQKNGIFHLHGNCVFSTQGSPNCPVIAAFDPLAFVIVDTPVEITAQEANGWSVWLYYLHSNNSIDVFQVNIYSTSTPQTDSLVDDRLEIHVSEGTWRWYHRGGDPRYHGI